MVPLIALLVGCVSLWSTTEDWDGDGWTVEDGDCADVDPSVNPAATELWYDGIDQDCDGNDSDADEDGHVAAVLGGDDCWDDPETIPSDFRVVPSLGWIQPTAWQVHPGAVDTWYDAVDANCAGDDDFDQDADQWRTAFHPDRDGLLGEDCLDGDPGDAANPGGIDPAEANPSADETWYDGTDQDCSDPESWDGAVTSWSDYDADGDGFPSGLHGSWDDIAEDCDDTDALRFPDPTIEEVWYDCVDQACDGNDGDQDGDGWLLDSYDLLCPETWDDPAFFLHGDVGDCADDPDAVDEPLNDLPALSASEIFPGGAETWYDGYDSDCAGDSDFDMDLDGHDAADQDNNTGTPGEDCDDLDPEVYPGRTEDCDTEADDDCDGDRNDEGADGCTDLYADADEDGYGGSESACLCLALPPYEFPDDSDCDDTNPAIHPGADEYCDPVDWDCDSVADESGSLDASTWYADSDADGFGNPYSSSVACEQPSDHLADDQDCDDTDPAVNPDATEVCNSTDDDCDGDIDESGTPDGTAYYPDDDGDGYGDETDDGDTYCTDPGSGYSLTQDDCDDDDSAVNPAATEICDPDDVDEDCNDLADDDDPGTSDASTWYSDLDLDGYGDETDPGTLYCDPPTETSATADDCDDGDASAYPGATDTWYDGVDSDCAGDDDFDQDLDGYQRDTDGGDDCDDTDAGVNPAATEICDSGLTDEDCDGLIDDDDDSVTGTSTWFADSDGDGAGDPLVTSTACEQPTDYVNAGGDCNDSDASAYLGASEICDGVDNDCDSSTDEGQSDVDGDGTCDALDTEECDGVDNDGDTAVDEGQSDVDGDGTCDALDSEVCDGQDNDGDGLVDDDDPDLDLGTATSWFADLDGDGYGDEDDVPDRLCVGPSGTIDDATDCDDTDSAVNPSATEACDGDDNDCDGDTDEGQSDVDGDGTCDALDSEECDGIDNDGDTLVDEGQPDSDADGTCDAIDAEECDGADNDGDGTVDESGAIDASTWYDDADEDGYGDAAFPTVACTAPSLTVADATDCDDTRADVNPGADELCDSDDNDCDSVVDEDTVDDPTWYADTDVDGYGDPDSATTSCVQPSGYEADGSDCDDTDPAIFPGASETEDLLDQDCDDAVDEDFRVAGDLVVTEVMTTPSGDQPLEEWWELTNVAGKDVALDGLYLIGDSGQVAVISPEGWVVADGESFVVCYDDAILGPDCDYVYGTDVNAASAIYQTWSDTLELGNSYGGAALMTNSGTIVDDNEWIPGTDGWPGEVPGSSWVLDPGAVDATSNDDGVNWCYPTSADTLSNGDFGTPGSVDTCQATAP